MNFKKLILNIALKIRKPILLRLIKKAGLFKIAKIRWIFNPNVLRRNFSYKNQSYLVSLKGVSGEIIEVDINDLIGYNLFVNKEMNPEILATCVSFRNSFKDIYMDIGANIGTTSIGPCLETNSRLICIEASKKNSSLLNKNIFKNGIQAWSLNCAVTDNKKSKENSFINFYLAPGNNGASSLNSEYAKAYSATSTILEQVPTSTIDKCIEFCNVNSDSIYLLKMDIEEEEFSALQGAKSVFGKVPILLEYVAKSEQAVFLIDFLTKKYKLYTFDSKLNLCEFEPKINHSSVLCIPILEHDNYLTLYKERSHLREKLLSKLPQYGLNRLKKENTVKSYN